MKTPEDTKCSTPSTTDTKCDRPGVFTFNGRSYCSTCADLFFPEDEAKEEEIDEEDVLVAEDDERGSTIPIQKHKADWT